MYSKTVTEKNVEYWALGVSAQEIRQALNEKQGIKADKLTESDKNNVQQTL